MSNYPDKYFDNLVGLLRSRAINLGFKSEGDNTNRGHWFAGQAEGLNWAAEHLEVLIREKKQHAS